jgi:HSP20 family protein
VLLNQEIIMSEDSRSVTTSQRMPVRSGAVSETPWNSIWQTYNQGFDKLLGDIAIPVRTVTVSETPWNSIWQTFNQSFDRLLGDIGMPIGSGFARALGPMPALELREANGGYQLTAELPGLAAADVSIEVGEGMLSLSGEKREESEHKEQGCLISERRYGAFKRQVALPSDIDRDKIVAEFKNGLLLVKLPKRADAAPRTRKISVGA